MRVEDLSQGLVVVHDRVGEKRVVFGGNEQMRADMVMRRIELGTLDGIHVVLLAGVRWRRSKSVWIGCFQDELAGIVDQACEPGLLRMFVTVISRQSFCKTSAHDRVSPVLFQKCIPASIASREILLYCRGDGDSLDRVQTQLIQ